MPELPEVETVCRGLKQAVENAVVRHVVTRRGDLRVPFPPDLEKRLAGRTLESIDRRAKYLQFHFSGGKVLLIHLGMSGRFLVEPSKPAAFGKHDHLVIELKDGRFLVFNDARRFGLAALTTEKKLPDHPLLHALGPEPFSKEFSADYLRKQLEARRGPVKPALMDQALVVGVGNIYASEALFQAGILPDRACRSVATESAAITRCIRKVLKAAIASGGSSLRDFLHITGYAGDFQHKFYVYGRAGKPCRVCKTPIQSSRQAGRTTFFCTSCQR